MTATKNKIPLVAKANHKGADGADSAPFEKRSAPFENQLRHLKRSQKSEKFKAYFLSNFSVALKYDENYLGKSCIITIPLCRLYSSLFFSPWKLKYPVKTHICAVSVFCHRYKLFFSGSYSKTFAGSQVFMVSFWGFSFVKLDFHGLKIDNFSVVESVLQVQIFVIFPYRTSYFK